MNIHQDCYNRVIELLECHGKLTIEEIVHKLFFYGFKSKTILDVLEYLYENPMIEYDTNLGTISFIEV